MAVLVTGGAGFIGSHFIEHLLGSGTDRVVCLDDFNNFYSVAVKRANVARFAAHPQATVVEGTFCDAEAMKQLFDDHSVTHVVHLGAYAGVRPSIWRPNLYQQTNVGGTLALLEAARHHPVERFLLISSSTVYGQPAVPPFKEDAPLGIPISPYGASKRAAELFGLTYYQLHRVPVVCLRPFSVYGPRLRPDLALCIWAAAIVDGRPLPLFGDGTTRRDFTYVTDVCAGLSAALVRPGIVGEAINLGNDQPIALLDAIAALAAQFDKPALVDRQPEKPGDMATTQADLHKAKRLLDYRPRVSFREGIGQFARWFMASHEQGAANGYR